VDATTAAMASCDGVPLRHGRALFTALDAVHEDPAAGILAAERTLRSAVFAS
jgi:hypothetical protein